MIKQEGGKWVLYSHDGEEVLGRFDTEAEAHEREREIMAAKHARMSARHGDLRFGEVELLETFGEEAWEEGTVKATGEPWLDVPARLFYAGKHKQRDYTEADLDRMASSFHGPTDDRNWSVPIQLDHSENARDTLGHVRNVLRAGRDLMGRLRFIGVEAVQNVKNGKWGRLSISLRPDLALREVSVTPFPHLAGARTFDEDQKGADAVSDDAKKTQNPPKPEKKAPDGTGQGETFVESEAVRRLREEFSAKTAAMETTMAELKKSNDEQAKVIRFAELTKQVDTFTEGGKTVPAMREAELKLLETFTDEQLALYAEVKKAQPALVDFSVRGHQMLKPPGESEDAKARAKVLAEKYGAKK